MILVDSLIVLEQLRPVSRDLIIGQYFADIVDPRIERTNDPALLALISRAMGAVICGADGWVKVKECGTTKHSWRETLREQPLYGMGAGDPTSPCHGHRP